MPRKRNKSMLLFLIVIIAGAGYFLTQESPEQVNPAAGGGEPPAPPVGVAEVVQRHVQEWREFSGRLAAVNTVEIRPRVAGTITAVHFKNGAVVKQGDPLFTIDPRPYEAALKAAEARAAFAQSEFKRSERLRKDNAVPQQEFEEKKNEAEVAEAELATAKLNIEYTNVSAPIAGRVGRAEITEGNLVGVGMPVLTTLVANSPIYADFEVDETTYLHYAKQAGGVSADARIPVKMGLASEDGTPHEGYIESFDNQLNPATGTIRVRALFENADNTLVPGLFARISLGSAGDRQSILITDRAIGTDQNRKFVLVVKPDNSTEHREVTLGGLAEGLRIVEDGLAAGEKIVVTGLQRVMMPGQKVTPEITSMDAPAEPGANPATPQAEAPALTDDALVDAITEPANNEATPVTEGQ